jgi:hypothetical protein
VKSDTIHTRAWLPRTEGSVMLISTCPFVWRRLTTALTVVASSTDEPYEQGAVFAPQF